MSMASRFNMKHQTLVGLLSAMLLFGCSSSDDIVPDVPPSQLYADAQTSLRAGSWSSAVEKLEALDSRYPFGPYSEQVQLDLIYAYYKNDELPLALATIERFTRLNPTHEKSDWVLYMRGLTHMAQDRNFLHDLFNIDRSDRDPEPVKQAFSDFKRLLQRYPASAYAEDAEQRMIALKKRLSEYDYATADFYIRRKAWIAAINRCQEIQRSYPDTEAARKSLRLQLIAYQELNLDDAVARTEKLIELNPL
ncbi:outer membrane protein biogenesis protein BamD [Vibrio ezurae NBRC 102218]|uniref:Outer membrane protein assembly factor BamD n=2 Tax=Vibrio ezurae TaxID=252583 RepID=U3B494_9VIBR|nr:outer membrane protein biogenesis protein BamD [Vibrio ezurae NBRC 102218]